MDLGHRLQASWPQVSALSSSPHSTGERQQWDPCCQDVWKPRCGIRVECRSSQGYAHGSRCIKVRAKPQLSEHLSPSHAGRTPAPRTLCSYHTGNTVTQRSLQQLLPTHQIFICNPKLWLLTFSMQQKWPTSFFFKEIMHICIDLITSLPQVLKEHAFVLLSWLQHLTLDHDFEGVFIALWCWLVLNLWSTQCLH